MPLLDHFRPPVSSRKGWEGFHSGWAFLIAQRLNGGILTNEHEAESNIHVGTAAEIDVATYEEEREPSLFGVNGSEGGTATAVRTYVAPAPAISLEATFADIDVFEVPVYKTEGGWKLVAAIELVSPANKDRPSHRRAFATKVAAYLQKGVSVVIVDMVTVRQANLHAEMVELMHLPDAADWSSPTGLSAVAYRAVGLKDRDESRLDVWPHALALGEPLPTLPLWLAPDLAVPLELELTYADACRSLRLG